MSIKKLKSNNVLTVSLVLYIAVTNAKKVTVSVIYLLHKTSLKQESSLAMDSNADNNSPISHEGGESRSHSNHNIASPSEEHCSCRPCRHNIRNNICIPGCSFIHKNEKGLYICEHHRDVTYRSCDSRTELEKKISFEKSKVNKLRQDFTNLLQEYRFLQTTYTQCDQAYIALHDEYNAQSFRVTQLEQENNYLRQQLDKHTQPKQFVAAFMERNPRHQPTRMNRGGYRGPS